MVCLDHFSLKCIIKNFYLISDDPLKCLQHNTHRMIGVGQLRCNVTTATNKTHNPALTDSVVLAGERKKSSTLSHVLKGEK